MTYSQSLIIDTTPGVFDAFSLNGSQKLSNFHVNEFCIDIIADCLSIVNATHTPPTNIYAHKHLEFSKAMGKNQEYSLIFSQLNILAHKPKYPWAFRYKHDEAMGSSKGRYRESSHPQTNQYQVNEDST